MELPGASDGAVIHRATVFCVRSPTETKARSGCKPRAQFCGNSEAQLPCVLERRPHFESAAADDDRRSPSESLTWLLECSILLLTARHVPAVYKPGAPTSPRPLSLLWPLVTVPSRARKIRGDSYGNRCRRQRPALVGDHYKSAAPTSFALPTVIESLS